MKKTINLLLVITIILGMISCATLTYGNKGKVTIYSYPDNVKADKLTVSKGKRTHSETNVYFPYVIPKRFSKGAKSANVIAYKDNTSKRITVNKTFNGWFAGNILIGGIFGMAIDLASGCFVKPEKNNYTIALLEQQQLYNNNNNNQIAVQEKDTEKTYSIEELQALGVINNKTQQDSQTAQQAQTQTTDNKSVVTERILSDVDKDIPLSNMKSENTFVLIIANENYEFVDDVEFALNDGNTFKEYCIKTLGVPEKQVWLYENASYGIINSGVSKMIQAMNLFDNTNAIIYYCGHGIPDEKTGDAYIIPTDGNGKDMATCYSLNTLYNTFSQTNALNVTYFMDACFTGAKKDGSMIVAARGVAREPKKETLSGNTIVFSATSADETAMTFKEKQHGLFTYYLLKKLQETKGNVTYEELYNYILDKVKRESFLTNDKLQTPMVATSPSMQDNWKNKTLK